ncbi:hypothetical protein, partial [Marivita sp.]|uniref:hypothetical protein n=1 Tax=Marivita sp. TaxID=2003365 RepID=UPI003219225D
RGTLNERHGCADSDLGKVEAAETRPWHDRPEPVIRPLPMLLNHISLSRPSIEATEYIRHRWWLNF